MPSWKVAVCSRTPLPLPREDFICAGTLPEQRGNKARVNPHGFGESAAVDFLLRFEPDLFSLSGTL